MIAKWYKLRNTAVPIGADIIYLWENEILSICSFQDFSNFNEKRKESERDENRKAQIRNKRLEKKQNFAMEITFQD